MRREETYLVIEFLRTAKYYYFIVLPFLFRHVVYRGAKEGSQIDLSYLFFLKTEGEKAERDVDIRRDASEKAIKKLGKDRVESRAF